MDYKVISLMGIMGAVSGYLSFLGVKELNGSVWFLPGFIFAFTIIIGMLVTRNFYIRRASHVLQLILWLPISTGAYYIAVYTTLTAFSYPLLPIQSGRVPFLLGGLAGGFVLILGFCALLASLDIEIASLLVLLSSLLTLTYFIGGSGIVSNLEATSSTGLLTLFVGWQTGMAMGFFVALEKSESNVLVA